MGLLSWLTGAGKNNKQSVEDIITIDVPAKVNAIKQYLEKYTQVQEIYYWFPETKDQLLIAGLEISMKPAREVSSGDVALFVEHHPSAAIEEQLLALKNIEKVIVFSSLNEPLFTLFGADKIKDNILKMGMQPYEVIKHKMISDSIASMQQKIDKQNFSTASANSQQEWLEKNYRN